MGTKKQFFLFTKFVNFEIEIQFEIQSRASFTCRSDCRIRLGNTGDALTSIVKKYRELQAKSKVSLLLNDSSIDEEDESNNTGCLSDTHRSGVIR